MSVKIEILKAISHPLRLKILECLCNGKKSVGEIMQACQEGQSNISKNLSILKNNGIVIDKKVGNQVFYEIGICCLDKFLLSLDKVAQESIKKQIQKLKNSITKEEK